MLETAKPPFKHGELNDLAITNNGDTDKVLATVVAALYKFFDKHPEALVYATGSTPTRTRLYRMGIHPFLQRYATGFRNIWADWSRTLSI